LPGKVTTILPSEFSSIENQKKIIVEILRITSNQKGKILEKDPDKLREIIHTTIISNYKITWVIRKDSNGRIMVIYPREYEKIT